MASTWQDFFLLQTHLQLEGGHGKEYGPPTDRGQARMGQGNGPLVHIQQHSKPH